MAPSNADEAAIVAESYWETLQGDVLATVEEYDAAGYDASELHPGMTSVLSPAFGDDHCGLRVLVLEDELQAVDSLIRSPGFEGADVYATAQGDIVLLAVFLTSTDPKRALGFPTYYLQSQAEEMLAAATADGSIDLVLRTQFDDTLVIELESPELFVPDDADGVTPDT